MVYPIECVKEWAQYRNMRGLSIDQWYLFHTPTQQSNQFSLYIVHGFGSNLDRYDHIVRMPTTIRVMREK